VGQTAPGPGSRVIIVAVHVRAMKKYIAGVEMLKQKERGVMKRT
jgi:hypothetical protein